MSNNYLVIEREGKYVDHVSLHRNDGTPEFENVMNMSYEDIKSYEDVEAFIVAIMDATNKHFDENDKQTIVNLVGEDDVFIWGIMIGPCDSDGDQLKYAFVDWKKDGKSYRYVND